jgi:hypothetical protein
VTVGIRRRKISSPASKHDADAVPTASQFQGPAFELLSDPRHWDFTHPRDYENQVARLPGVLEDVQISHNMLK